MRKIARSTDKTVFMLVGPKGSGKTYLGTLIESKLKLHFFRVEKFWLSFGKIDFSDEFIERGFATVEKELDHCLATFDNVLIESTASFDYFKTFLNNLRSRYQVKLVRVRAPHKLCFERIRSRDQTEQVRVSEQMIAEMHDKTINVALDFDLELNNATTTDEEIVAKFQSFLENLNQPN